MGRCPAAFDPAGAIECWRPGCAATAPPVFARQRPRGWRSRRQSARTSSISPMRWSFRDSPLPDTTGADARLAWQRRYIRIAYVRRSSSGLHDSERFRRAAAGSAGDGETGTSGISIPSARRAGLKALRRGLVQSVVGRSGRPSWHFRDETFDRTAPSFDNPDFVDVVIHSYRHRLGNAPGEPRFAAMEQRLAQRPKIGVPTIIPAWCGRLSESRSGGDNRWRARFVHFTGGTAVGQLEPDILCRAKTGSGFGGMLEVLSFGALAGCPGKIGTGVETSLDAARMSVI